MLDKVKPFRYIVNIMYDNLIVSIVRKYFIQKKNNIQNVVLFVREFMFLRSQYVTYFLKPEAISRYRSYNVYNISFDKCMQSSM